VAARRRRAEDDHVCPAVEAYLLTYSDMITALLIFFIVMFAMGQIDIAKFEKFKMGIARSGATPIDDGLLENGEGPFEQAIIRPDVIQAPDDLDGPGGDGDRNGFGPDTPTNREQRVLDEARRQITAALAAASLDSDVTFRIEERGMIITVASDRVLFAPGSADLSPEGRTVVDALAGGLAALPNRLTVEGHTDSRPISTARFPSNWELSVGRASTVLRALVEQHGFPPARLNAAGYADQRPVGANDTAPGRAANRRVEIVVHRQGVEADAAAGFRGGS
jgi:chemotaxis protein MotB